MYHRIAGVSHDIVHNRRCYVYVFSPIRNMQRYLIVLGIAEYQLKVNDAYPIHEPLTTIPKGLVEYLRTMVDN